MFREGALAFPEVLNLARPGKILVFSRKSWRYMAEIPGLSIKKSVPVYGEGLAKPAPVRLIQPENETFACDCLNQKAT